MESNKVKLLKEVAEAIELMKAKGASLNAIVSRHVTGNLLTVNHHKHVEALDLDTLIRALYIGYEIEQSPEDEVRKYFNNLKASCNWSATGAIENVLEMLNITIKGVNEHE